jgi:hypothetical protein
MKITNKTDQTLTLSALQIVVAPGETVEVPDDVGKSLKAQGWSPAAKKATGKGYLVKETD